MVEADACRGQQNTPQIGQQADSHHQGDAHHPDQPSGDKRRQVHGHDVQLDYPLGVVKIVPGHFRHTQGRCSHDKAHHRITNGCTTDGGPDQGIAENLTHGATTAHHSLGHPFPGRPITDRHHNQGTGKVASSGAGASSRP